MVVGAVAAALYQLGERLPGTARCSLHLDLAARAVAGRYDPALLARKNGGAPPLTYQAFCKLLDKVGPPPAPLDAPSSLPPPRPDAATQVRHLSSGRCSLSGHSQSVHGAVR
jgi:hypothetical protein